MTKRKGGEGKGQRKIPVRVGGSGMTERLQLGETEKSSQSGMLGMGKNRKTVTGDGVENRITGKM